MKNTKIFIATLFLIGFQTINSCKKEETEKQNSNEPQFIKNFGASVNKDFLIEVIDEEGNQLSNTSIQIGDFIGKTDANGILLKKSAKVYEKHAFIKASKPGYITGGRSLIPGEGTNKVVIRLMEANLSGALQSGKSGSVSLPGGAKVEFDGAFEDENGTSYSGEVKVFMKQLTSSDKDIGTKMPGMLYGEREDGSESGLETYGMLSVNLLGSSGQIIQPAKGHKAKITIPIDPSQISSAPSSIPLWHFDEKYGYWKEEGSAVRIGNLYSGEVAHFTWWNCGFSFPSIAIHLNVIDLLSNPLPWINIKIVRNTDQVFSGFTNDKGKFSGRIPLNQKLELKVINLCGEEVYSAKIGPFLEETILSDIKVNDKTLTLKGVIKNCMGEDVKEGYIEVKIFGNKPEYFSFTNGKINTGILSCKMDTYKIVGFDNTTFLTSNTFEGTLSKPVSDFGILTACDSSSEYISYSVDSNPIKVLKSLIECYDKNDGFELSAKYGLEYFQISSKTKSNGKHCISDMSLSTGNIHYASGGADIVFNLKYGKSEGDFVDIEFSGSFKDVDDLSSHTVKGIVHVKRDN